MQNKEKTLQVVANILGNISAISAGIAIFEKSKSGLAIFIALIFASMAVYTARRIE